MAELRPKIVKLAKTIGGLTGMVNKIDENAPEYYCMAAILTDDEADVAIACGLRHERTTEYLAKKVGKPIDEVQKIADSLMAPTARDKYRILHVATQGLRYVAELNKSSTAAA